MDAVSILSSSTTRRKKGRRTKERDRKGWKVQIEKSILGDNSNRKIKAMQWQKQCRGRVDIRLWRRSEEEWDQDQFTLPNGRHGNGHLMFLSTLIRRHKQKEQRTYTHTHILAQIGEH